MKLSTEAERSPWVFVTRRYMSREVSTKLIDPDNPQALLDARKAA